MICQNMNDMGRLFNQGEVPIGQVADPGKLLAAVHKEDWDRYRLVLKANDAKHFVKDVSLSEIHDHDEAVRSEVRDETT